MVRQSAPVLPPLPSQLHSELKSKMHEIFFLQYFAPTNCTHDTLSLVSLLELPVKYFSLSVRVTTSS